MQKLGCLLIFVAALIGALSACGETEDAPVSLEAFSEQYTDAVCARAFSCCTVEELSEAFDDVPGAYDRGDFSTEEECRTELYPDIAELFSNRQDAIDDGIIKYQPDKVSGCLRELQSVVCGEGLRPEGSAAPACDQVFEGQVEEGKSCLSTFECREGRCLGVYLASGVTTSDLKYGWCGTPGDIGDKCGRSVDCKDGNYCVHLVDPETGQLDRISTCQRIAQIGEPCTQYGCVKEAYCDIGSSESPGSRTCKPSKGVGEPCLPGQCNTQAYCDEPGGGQCAATKPNGESCRERVECANHFCGASTDASSDDTICRDPSNPKICDGV